MPREEIGAKPPVFRLPENIRIGTVTLQVADLDRSLDFYVGVVGFRLMHRTGGIAELAACGTADILLALHEKPGVRAVPRRGLLGLYHSAVLLPSRGDLGRFLRHVQDRRVEVGTADHLISEALYLVDPDGMTVEVCCDRERSDWEVTVGGEILATIDPLDHAALLAEAGSTEWTGLPVGTRIGHMHFYVGDLRSAAAFYHSGLGFDKVLWSLPGALFVSAGGYHHHVGLNTWAAGSPVATDDDARLLSWELIVPDESTLEAAVESLRRTVHPVTIESRGYRASDPWGNSVVLRRESQPLDSRR